MCDGFAHNSDTVQRSLAESLLGINDLAGSRQTRHGSFRDAPWPVFTVLAANGGGGSGADPACYHLRETEIPPGSAPWPRMVGCE